METSFEYNVRFYVRDLLTLFLIKGQLLALTVSTGRTRLGNKMIKRLVKSIK